MADPQRKPLSPIVVHTVVPRDTPSPEEVLRRFLEEDRAELDSWRRIRGKY
jgi:hypothetical protein